MSCERVFKGNIVFAKNLNEYELIENGYIVVEENKVFGVYKNLPKEFQDSRIYDYEDKLIIPGFNDLGIDIELSGSDAEETEISEFVKNTRKKGIVKSVLNASLNMSQMNTVFELMAKSGLSAFISLVAFSLNDDSKKLLSDIEEFLLIKANEYEFVKPMVTVKTENYSEEFLNKLLDFCSRYRAPVNFLKESGDSFTLALEKNLNNKMLNDINNMKSLNATLQNVFISYSKNDLKNSENLCLSESRAGLSNISEIRKDISRLLNKDFTLNGFFYLGTKGGGSFFGNSGSFEKGYEFDALIINDKNLSNGENNLQKRIENYLLYGKDENIECIYINGQRSLGI